MPFRPRSEMPGPEEMHRTLAEYRELTRRIRILPRGTPEEGAAVERARRLEREIHSWRARSMMAAS